ncbi:O-antigen ligase family protein [Alsobacter sp. KACC 23698]|uniref:O-antigen ligase family protein n=1 Tax=Alsobacter sp. KACC 23698 TaxID=3149229 RepID=A0AAU7JJ49_9HYPH
MTTARQRVLAVRAAIAARSAERRGTGPASAAAPTAPTGSWLPPLSAGPMALACAALAALYVALAAAAFMDDDYVSLVLILAIPFAPVALLAGQRALMGVAPYSTMLAIGIVLIESASWRTREYADKSIDLQVALKLGGIALLLALSAPTVFRSFRTGLATPWSLWLGWLGFTIMTCVYAVAPAYAAVAAVSITGGYLYLWSIGEEQGETTVVKMMILACFVLCAASVVVYFAVPSLGRMSDWVNNVFVPTSRLQGVFGSANAAGSAGAVGLMLSFLVLERGKRGLLFWAAVGSFAFCLVLSNNRMALAAAGLAFGYVFIQKGDKPLKIALLLVGAGVAAVAGYLWGEQLLDLVSRSGSAEEVLTGTGRTRIWEVVISLWLEHPLLGLGFTSSGQILPKNEMLFVAAAHAHNVFLETLFSGGLVGLGLFMAALIASIRRAARAGAHAKVAYLLFFMLYGMTEPIVNGLVGFPSMSFALACILPVLQDRRTRPNPLGLAPLAGRSPEPAA